jgi:nucleoside-diphosphate-sugar epimerase
MPLATQPPKWTSVREKFAAPEEQEGRGRDAVLVIGGSGYIGSILVRKLLAAGHTVRVLDNQLYGDAPLREVSNHPRLEIITADVRDLRALIRATAGMQSAVHLAAIVGDPACQAMPQTALEVNYGATRLLIEVAAGAGIRRFVFASSCSVYGATDSTINEECEVKPLSLYARTKVDSEAALLRAACPGFHPVILRLATVFGLSYRPRFDLAVNVLSARAHIDRHISIQNGRNWRPFIHVQDVAEGIVLALRAPLETVGGQIFNLGDTRLNFTLNEIGDCVRRVFPGTDLETSNDGDARNYRVNFEKIRSALGFRCKLSIEDGIHEIRGALERREVPDYTSVLYNNYKFLQSIRRPVPGDSPRANVVSAFLIHEADGHTAEARA